MKHLEIKENIYWVGMLDPELRVFDIIMRTKFGTTYNSYIVKGTEKTALIETAKAKFYDDYLEKISSIVDIKDIDYIILNHTEPDHTGSVEMLTKLNPDITVVGSSGAIQFIEHIINKDFKSKIVKDKEEISLGNKTLKFINAPNLHWPDSMYTYIPEDNTLFSCDSFGSHYCLDTMLQSTIENHDDYMEAVKYYYDMILGPFKPFFLKAISKIEQLKIDLVCPGHGPILDEDPWKIINLSKEWSTEVNPNKNKTVIIPYVSAYGYTKEIAEHICKGIKELGIDCKLYDLVYADTSEVLNEIYWADGLLFGSPTILGEALKPIWDVLTSMVTSLHGRKFASAFGSYGWSGEAVPNIMTRLKQLRMKINDEGFTVRFKGSEKQLEEAYQFGKKFGEKML